MTQVGEAIARYHKLIESEPYIDLAWAKGVEDQMKAAKLAGRPISPVLRPHFLSHRDYAAMAKAAETVLSALSRVEQMALTNPAFPGAVSKDPQVGINKGQTAVVKFTAAKPGKYLLICGFPGHALLGMYGLFEVSPSAATKPSMVIKH